MLLEHKKTPHKGHCTGQGRLIEQVITWPPTATFTEFQMYGNWPVNFFVLPGFGKNSLEKISVPECEYGLHQSNVNIIGMEQGEQFIHHKN